MPLRNLTDNRGTVSLLNLVDVSTDYPLIPPRGRLTLSSTSAVADITDGTNIYYLPYTGDLIPLWNNSTSRWVYRRFTSLSINIGSNTTVDRPLDLYSYLQTDGTVGFSSVYWTSATARATALSSRSGIYYLSGLQTNDATWLGSAYITGTSGAAKANDLNLSRTLFNAYNQVRKRISRIDTTASWTYSGSSWRPWNNSTVNRVAIMDGLGEGMLDLSFVARVLPSSGNGQIGMGLDSTTALTDAYAIAVGSGTDQTIHSRICRSVGLGYHYVQALEQGNGSVAATFYGSPTFGLMGTWLC